VADDLEQAHGNLMAWSGEGSLLELVRAHEAAVREDQARVDRDAARESVRATGDVERVEAAVDGLVAVTRAASWTLARAVVEDALGGTTLQWTCNRLVRLMNEAEGRQSRG